MAATIDSKKNELSIPEILIRTIDNNPVKGLTTEAAIAALVQEGAMPNTEVSQYGNTVFFTHYGTGKNKDLVVGRALNVDTASNFIANGEQYFRDLYKNDVRRFVTQFEQPSFASAFKQLQRKPITSEMKVYILPTPSGQTQVRVVFAGELL